MQPVQSLSDFIFEYLETRIQLGFYQKGECLPTLRELSELFCVSLATVKKAVNRLAAAGHVKADKAVRPVVTAAYTPAELRENLSRHAMARQAAFGEVEACFSYFIPTLMLEGLRLCDEGDALKLGQYLKLAREGSIRYISNFTCKILSKLNNPLCTRLYMTAELFYSTFYEKLSHVSGCWEESDGYRKMVGAYEKLLACWWSRDGEAMKGTLDYIYRDFFVLYRGLFQLPADGLEHLPQVSFAWEVHGSRPQVYMQLVSEIVKNIIRRFYPPGDYLPSEGVLAEKYGTTVISVRRAIVQLTAMGLVKNRQGRGIWVLPFDLRRLHADFQARQHQKNLITYLRALQIIALTCREIAADTLPRMDGDHLAEAERWLSFAANCGNVFLTLGVSLEVIAGSSRYSVIRTVYTRLLTPYRWGYSLAPFLFEEYTRFLPSAQALRKAFMERDAARFSEMMERLAMVLFHISQKSMLEKGISEAEGIQLGSYSPPPPDAAQ